MFAAGYVGTSADSQRIRRQEKEREEAKKKYEAAQKGKQDELNQAGLRQFAATTSEALEHAFKNETIGLVTKEEFIKKRCTLAERMEEEQRKKAEAEEAVVAKERERKRLQKMGAGAKKLSFAMDEEEEEGEQGNGGSPAPSAPASKMPSTSAPAPDSGGGTGPSTSGRAAAGAADANRAAASSLLGRLGATTSNSEQEGGAAAAGGEGGAGGPPDAKRPRKLGKNPNAATEFLPDRDRARREMELREELKKEYQAQQDRIKAEPLMIVYSYWDGAGHRREIKIKKGDTIGGFLKAVREQLVPEFRELRHVSVDNLLYVKEDIIMPHHYTFQYLIASKARGKSGPLFDFGVHEDIRVVNDASREKNESHAGKVVERHWYDRNKHIFPASRWEVFDPEKKWDSYSIYSGENDK